MFGITVLIIIVFYAIWMSISNGIEDNKGKKNYRNNRFNTYLDHNNLSRDLKTNRYRSITRDSKGDIHLWGKDIGDINVSQHEREKELTRYKNLIAQGHDIGRTTIYWMPSPNYDIAKSKNIIGKRYKDIATGRVFVIRIHKYISYYVDADKMKVIRYTDFQRYNMKKHNTYSEEKERNDVIEFQNYINDKKNDKDYIGDPTKGIGSYNLTRLEDYWKPTKEV